jgi:hypothetical protein
MQEGVAPLSGSGPEFLGVPLSDLQEAMLAITSRFGDAGLDDKDAAGSESDRCSMSSRGS